jgi:hypothetical protein
VVEEVVPAGPRHLKVLASTLMDLSTSDFVSLTLVPASHIGLNILISLLDIAGDIKSITRSLRDG